VWLSVVNTFSGSLELNSFGGYVKSWIYYTNQISLDLVVRSSSSSQYEISWDLNWVYTGYGSWIYDSYDSVTLEVWDWEKQVKAIMQKEQGSGVFEILETNTISVVLDKTFPTIVELNYPDFNQNVDWNIVFLRDSVVDTGVGLEKYNLVIARDINITDIVFLWDSQYSNLNFNLNTLSDWIYYRVVYAEDFLWNSSVSLVSSFVVWEIDDNYVAWLNLDMPKKVSGWKRWYTIIDSCPDWDYSYSYLDSSCGNSQSNLSEFDKKYILNKEDFENKTKNMSDTDLELYTAYQYARYYNITTMSFEEVDLYWSLLRKHFAKMIVNFASWTMGLWDIVNTWCVFDDVDWQSEELRSYMQLACEHGFMGLEYNWVPANSFWPDLPVSRAMFGTVLSRFIFGEQHNWNQENWYWDHLIALKKADIMKFIEYPHNIELRWYAFVMFKRADENWYLELKYKKD